MGVGDVRYTVLQTVNEVFRKLGLSPVTSVNDNTLSREMVDFINDICNELSDFGNWQEMLVSANVSCVSSTMNYLIPTSGNIKNIADIYFSQRTGPMRHVTLEDMRIRTRVTAVGVPIQYTIFGTDISSGNPIIRVWPKPVSAQSVGGIFSVLYYQRPPLYSTADSAVIIPFPARIVVLGVLAKAVLNESEGAITDRYTKTYQDYLLARKEALNRFNGDSGWSVSFRPAR
jgi:hypothetical protein